MYIYIRSMSEKQSEIYRKLTSASDQINLHIVKLLMFPNCSYVDHWMHEIWSFLFKVDKLKSNNKWPKQSFIKNALAVHNDIINTYIVIAPDEEENLDPKEVSISYALQCIEEYQDWISEKLSSEGVVRQVEVKSKLREICNLQGELQ